MLVIDAMADQPASVVTRRTTRVNYFAHGRIQTRVDTALAEWIAERERLCRPQGGGKRRIRGEGINRRGVTIAVRTVVDGVTEGPETILGEKRRRASAQ